MRHKNLPKTIDFFDLSPIASIIVDENLNIIKSSKATKNIYNFPDDVEQNFSYVLSEESTKLLNSNIKNLSQIDLTTVDGKNIELHISSFIENGQNYFLLSMLDQTKYKSMESNFFHLQKILSFEKSSLVIAHDFNNLLTAITLFTDLLVARYSKEDSLPEELLEIKKTLSRAILLVNQILTFSNKSTSYKKLVNVNDSLSDLSALIAKLLGNKIELIIDYGKNIKLAQITQGQFEQVIMNLVINAKDAMTDSGTLMIKTENITINKDFKQPSYYVPLNNEELAEGDYVLITISDTGSGIKDDILDKIFQPFFSTKDLGLGSGLGLATVLAIMNQDSGYIRLSTSKTDGTIFYIFLKSVECDESNVDLDSKTNQQIKTTEVFI